MSNPDPVLRGLVKAYMNDLSTDERAALIAEVAAPPTDPTPDQTVVGSLKAGAELYEKQHGRHIQVEGPDRSVNGKWS